MVEDGYVDFCKHFKYLGSFVSYNLSDDYDISQRITKAYQMMGMLNNLWRNDHVDLYSKYLFFLAMPISQLLWGCEGWALKESNFDDLDVFLHRSIRKILGVRILQVQEERISNADIRKRFYDIPDIRRMIATRTLQFVGKICRREDEFIPKQLLTAWVNSKRPRGRPIATNKESISKALRLLYTEVITDIVGNVVWRAIGRECALHCWYADALDKTRWQWLIDSKLRYPHRDIPEPSRSSAPRSPPPRDSSSSRPATPPPASPPQRGRRRENYRTPPPREQPSTPPSTRSRSYDPDGIGRNLRDSLAILGFSLGDNVSEMQIRRRYMQMARKYHPDKNKPEETGRNQEEATQFFQLLNNAQAYLRDRL